MNSKTGTNSFLEDQAGSVAMQLGFFLLPLLIAVGLALDMSRLRSAQSTAGAAIDAAVLSTAKEVFQNQSIGKGTDTQISQFVNDVFEANLNSLHSDVNCSSAEATIMRRATSVSVTANCELPTTFAGLIGLNQFQFEVSSSAAANVTFLDLALVLDTSGSMEGARIEALRDAATEAVNTLVTNRSGGRARVALAPYNTSVNIGEFFSESTGVDLVPLDDGDGTDGASGADGIGNNNGNGRTTRRADGRFAEDSNDESESLGFEAVTCATEREGIFAKTDRDPSASAAVGGESNRCPQLAVLPLTSNRPRLITAISQLEVTPQGQTAGHLGVEWAWYLLSEAWGDVWPEGSEPLPVDDASVVKAAILMTDGRFNVTYDDTQGGSSEQAIETCEKMREQGIIIYSVAFQAPTEGQETLRNCASSDSHFYVVETTSDLSDVYSEIATELTGLRLTQ